MKGVNMERTDRLFRVILRQDSGKGFTAYAQTYAQAGIGMEGETLRIQILYVLSNLQSWRGEQAREVKKELNQILKELQ